MQSSMVQELFKSVIDSQYAVNWCDCDKFTFFAFIGIKALPSRGQEEGFKRRRPSVRFICYVHAQGFAYLSIDIAAGEGHCVDIFW